MEFHLSPELAFAITLALIPTIFFLYSFSNKTKTNYRPIPSTKPNVKPSTIVDLRIYPVKSCRGFSVESAELLQSGLELDRQWMFVERDASNNKHKFITIRGDARMTLINTAINRKTDELVLSVDEPAIRIAVPAHPTKAYLENNTEAIDAEIWSKDTATRAYPLSLTDGISGFLNKEVRLVYKGKYTEPRLLRGNGAPQYLGREQSLGFADMMPVLVASLASMAELNARLRKTGEVHGDWSIERFRPNIIIQGNVPWEEDSWKLLQITKKGQDEEDDKKLRRRDPKATGPPFVFDVASRCMRCQVPNVDPDTAEKHKHQPWDTLMSYRRIDEGSKYKPAFGMLCCPRNEGRLELGMQLEVLETVDDHLFRSPMQA